MFHISPKGAAWALFHFSYPHSVLNQLGFTVLWKGTINHSPVVSRKALNNSSWLLSSENASTLSLSNVARRSTLLRFAKARVRFSVSADWHCNWTELFYREVPYAEVDWEPKHSTWDIRQSYDCSRIAHEEAKQHPTLWLFFHFFHWDWDIRSLI